MMVSALFDDLHCSLGSGPSFVDPVTNLALISGVKLDRDLAGMLQAGRYPQQYLPAFLHELTHHWCFHSPVGTALALLQLRAQRCALLPSPKKVRGGPASEDTAERATEDLVRYETAISLMRPFQEGLALFAEFDAFPGASPVASQVMLLTAVCFVELVDGDEAGNIEHLRELLIRHRLSAACLDRKMNLLAQPFENGRRAYLPGYLAIKNLWHALVAKSRELLDTDLFLTYVRSFVYEDWQLVSILLDPGAHVDPFPGHRNDSAQAISTHFQRRLGQLPRQTTDDGVKSFESYVLHGVPPCWPCPDPAVARQGMEALHAALAHLADDFATDREEPMGRPDILTLAQRELFCVGSFQAPVRVNEHRRALVGQHGAVAGVPLLAVPAFLDAKPASGAGSVEFFLSESRRLSVLTVSLGDHIVAVHSGSQNLTEALKNQIREYRTTLAGLARRRGKATQALDALLADTASAVIRDHYRSEFVKVAASLCRTWALLQVPDAQLDSAARALQDHGVLGLLGDDPSLLESLAKLGLVNSLDRSRGAARKYFSLAGVNLDSVICELNRHGERHGLPLVHDLGGIILTCV